MSGRSQIKQFVIEHQPVSAKDIVQYMGNSKQSVFKHLGGLIDKGSVAKKGSTPKVYYYIPQYQPPLKLSDFKIDKNLQGSIEKTFYYTSPVGQVHTGFTGFVKWCQERNLHVASQAIQYVQVLETAEKFREEGLIGANNRLIEVFEHVFLDNVFYLDFYSLPQFGKTRLGQKVLTAKLSQEKGRIESITDEHYQTVERFINENHFDAIGFIPPTIKRETQLMKVLEEKWNFDLPILNLVKIKTEVTVAQKSLRSVADRVQNASYTIVYDDKRKFKNVLLIDDAVGSGATFNETARQIKHRLPEVKVTGLAMVGSYKGFEVISEV